MLDKSLKNKLLLCFLIALEIVFCFTPLGTIPLGPIAATLSMIPVIIASLVYGKKIGALMGFLFATFSFVYWTFIMPSYISAFLFTPFAQFAGYAGNAGSLVICFVPRILAGLAPAVVLNGIKGTGYDNSEKVSHVSLVIASIVGSLTNTILVLLFIVIFFRVEYEQMMGKAIFTVLGVTVLTNGIPEAVIAAIVCPVVSKKLKQFLFE